MKKTFLLSFLLILSVAVFGQDIPEHISYTRIYDFLDELANEQIIDLNSAIKPYSREMIASKLMEAKQKSQSLSRRQQAELNFFLNDYASELDDFPKTEWNLWKKKHSLASLLAPQVIYHDSLFRARITPIIGIQVTDNDNGSIVQRWIGADFQSMIGKHISIWGSLRDMSNYGDTLSSYRYLNLYPGYEYKEASYGGDYSDSRGGIMYSEKWGSIGLLKDNIEWGDNYHGSNILSGRAPSFPMISLHLKPAKWFELNYFHAWLVSNVLDSSYYYLENGQTKFYRPANKFMAANMMTFTPLRGLKFSVGNSIIYAEKTVQLGYFIPIAFYKSIDHTLTKGLNTENQNSQVFMNLSIRRLKYFHFYSSLYVDEFSIARLSPKNKQANPMSIKAGVKCSDFPLQNVSGIFEFTRTNILNYKHSIPLLTYASNSYNLGSYLGDNSQEIYFELQYKPIRGLDLTLSYTDAKHGNEYNYIRKGISNGIYGNVNDIISQPSLGDIIWSEKAYAFDGVYEVMNNVYATATVEYSDIRGYEPTSPVAFGEVRMTAQQTLDLFTPKYLQGKHLTFRFGLNFGF